MYKIEIVDDKDIKSKITDKILRLLPEWFGVEKSIVEYVQNVRDKVFYAAYDGDEIIGFMCLKSNNKYTADIYVTGILKEYHRNGIGKRLVLKAEQYLRDNNYRFLMVKTLSELSDYEPYRLTREFYKSVGFFPLEEIKEIWDEENPCLIMIKNV